MTQILRAITTLYFLAALIPANAFAADPRWIRMAADDFEIFSTAGEGDTRRALEHFQQVSDFFASASHGKLSTNDPIRIVIFGSKKEYAPYKPNEIAVAYYTQSGGRDYIVLGNLGDNSAFQVAVHEYVHLIVQHGGFKLPPWLNEGLAELYSTLRPVGGKVLVGGLIPGRMQALLREKWVPLPVILAADRDSPYYNEKNRAGSLYNEGWALTHMMALTPEYGNGYSEVVAEIQAGTPSAQALEKAYGKPLAEIEKSLQAYVRGDRFRGSVFDIKLQKTKDRAEAEPASPFDVKLALADLISRPGKQAEARSGLEALVAEDPSRPEPDVALGYLALQSQEREKAAAYFAKAFGLGSRNPKMLWDYGRLAGESTPPTSIAALKALLEQEPDRRDVRLTLAEIEMQVKQAPEALDVLKPVKSISADDAPRFFRLLAYASLETGDRAGARKLALRWIENTKDERDKENGKRLIQFIDNSLDDRQERAGGPTQAANRAPVPPTFNDPDPFEPKGDLTPALPTVAGAFVEMQCDGPRSLIVVESGAGRSIFLMDDPDLVTAFGSGALADHVDVTCGKQKPVRIAVQYTPAIGAEPEVTGVAKRIHFEQKPEALANKAAEPESVKPLAPERPFEAGTFVEMDCRSLPPKLVLQTSAGRVALLLDSPETLVAYGLKDGGSIDLVCGAQIPVAMWIEYDLPAKPLTGVKGLARALHYEERRESAPPLTSRPSEAQPSARRKQR
jgi:Tfp pilus assembly protein PilF